MTTLQTPVLPLLTGEPQRNDGWFRLALFLAWLAFAGWLALHHVVWRDEVRAFTLATAGDSVWTMLWNIHGEGHPALWYLLLRAGYNLTAARGVLPVTAFAIAAAAAALVAWRAPFRPLVVATVLFSAYAMVDYAVVARNYGLSFLLLIAIAELYALGRDRGLLLGLLLFLLCNTNVLSVLLAGGVLLFWAIELWLANGWRWTPAVRQWLVAAIFAGLGVLTCLVVVYPPYNDAASGAAGEGGWPPFDQLSGGLSEGGVGAALFVALLIGGLAGLARAPAALIASLAVMTAAALFFHFVYPGLYRHQALILIFLLAMYWLVAKGRGGRWRWEGGRPLFLAAERYGAAAFIGLLGLQTLMGWALFGLAVQGIPFSRSRDLALLLDRPALRRAVVIGNPDVVLEPLSYYRTNPVWLIRERRWGRVVAFTRAAMRDVSLGEMLDTARRLRARTGRPVIIVLHDPLEPNVSWRYDQGYLGGFTSTPRQVRAFQMATRRLARLGPAQTDETYDVYLLTGS